MLFIQERLPTSEVDLSHTRGFEEGESPKGILDTFHVGSRCGMKTKATALVALPSKMIIHGDRAFRGLGGLGGLSGERRREKDQENGDSKDDGVGKN